MEIYVGADGEMTTVEIVWLCIIVFNVGFVGGCAWVSRGIGDE